MRSAGLVSSNGKLTLGNKPEEEDTKTKSKPRHVWATNHAVTPTSMGDQTTINLVMMKRVFPKVKFVDRDISLVFSNDKWSICQFVVEPCHLNVDISLPCWWKPARKSVTKIIKHLQDDCNTTNLGRFHLVVSNIIMMQFPKFKFLLDVQIGYELQAASLNWVKSASPLLSFQRITFCKAAK
jgi:hypothetical protein